MSARAFVVLWYCCFLSVQFEMIFRADKNRKTKIHFEFQQTIDTLNIMHVVIRAASMFDIWMIVQSSTIKTRTENGAGAVESCTAFNGKTFHYLCTGNVEPIGSLGTKWELHSNQMKTWWFTQKRSDCNIHGCYKRCGFLSRRLKTWTLHWTMNQNIKRPRRIVLRAVAIGCIRTVHMSVEFKTVQNRNAFCKDHFRVGKCSL